MIWEADRVLLLRRLWADGVSASAIASEINRVFPGHIITKGAVTGARQRFNLPGRPSPLKPGIAEPRQRKERVRPRKKSKPLPVVAPKPQAPKPLMLQTEQLTPHTCRFPIGHPRDKSFGYCGHQTSDRTYCEFHRSITHHKLPPKETREPGRLEMFTRKLNVGVL